MTEKIAPTLHLAVESPFFMPGTKVKLRAELRALLRCARVLLKIRAAGGAWNVGARGEADRALAAVDKASHG